VQGEGQLCLVVDVSGGPQADRDEAVANLISHGVSGIIHASPFPAPVETSPLLGQTRCIFVNCWPIDPAVAEAVVLADEYGGGRLAADAAFHAGHTDVAYLGGPPDDYACIERRRGFVDAATAAGLDPNSLHQSTTSYQISAGYDATLKAYRHGHPTALVCGNDRMAVGALLALHTMRLEVPTDVSIIGFDDQPDMAAELQPALTTVRLPHLQMGYEAGLLLLAPTPPPTSNGTRPLHLTVPCPLIERASLAPPPNAAARPSRTRR
jgi:LacI family transcriptional regulator